MRNAPSAPFTPSPLRGNALKAALRGLVIGLLAATTLMRAQCQQLLEEETDVRVSKQVPESGSCGTTPTTFALEFSGEMDASSVTAVNGGGGACTANVQVSANNFTTCLNFVAAPTTDDKKQFVYTPQAPGFVAATSYKIKVTTGAKSSSGKAISSEYISPAGFGDGDQLVISEVGYCRYTNQSCWFEIHNKSSQCTAKLNKYHIRATYTPGFNAANKGVFTFPAGASDSDSASIGPGAYLLIRGLVNSSKHFNSPGQYVLYDEANSRRPYWQGSIPSGGAIEIVGNGPNGTAGDGDDITMDFVRFGTSGATSATGGEMAGGEAPMWAANDEQHFGKSIARNANQADTNAAADWTQRAFATPGAPNDVTCDTDADNDGIPDCSEVSGSTYAGLNLYAMGARTGQRDVFLEVDYMDSTDPGVIPQKAALDKVKAVFAARGYKLHFDVGDLYHQADGINEAFHDLGNASAKVPFAQGIELGGSADKANFYTYKYGHMDQRRRGVFYYVLFAYSRNADGSAGSSGVAEILGNDAIVSLGNWGLAADSNRLINYQASTLMHEWGHNLGLYHGGDDSDNYKPNYYSIMNYHYQLAGLPALNNNPGDRYYLYRRNNFGDCSLITSVSQLTNNYNSPTFKMDFSTGAGGIINETTGISEAAGLNGGSSAVDFNCNGSIGAIAGNTKDLNGDGYNSLNDYDDWGNITIFFNRQLSGVDSGYFQVIDGEKIHIDPIGNDRQPVVDEPDMAWARAK